MFLSLLLAASISTGVIALLRSVGRRRVVGQAGQSQADVSALCTVGAVRTLLLLLAARLRATATIGSGRAAALHSAKAAARGSAPRHFATPAYTPAHSERAARRPATWPHVVT